MKKITERATTQAYALTLKIEELYWTTLPAIIAAAAGASLRLALEPVTDDNIAIAVGGVFGVLAVVLYTHLTTPYDEPADLEQ